ncbi:MAG: PQQ-binding-like beta-propeller repeat protein [Phycisphaeraceae bacterium]|nr:PQQ-binding-like beta-propeller repeat protein [Phycisphaeraceae bacterium]
MFRFAQMTDTHLYTDDGSVEMRKVTDSIRHDMFKALMRQCASHHVDFIVHTGDLCGGHAKEPLHRQFKQLCDELSAELKLPIYLTRGNHDATVNCPDEVYHRVHGPGTYAFTHKSRAFLVVDRYYRAYEHTQHAYALSYETLTRVRELAADIPRDMSLVMLLHDDPIGISHFYRGTELFHALEHHNLKLVLFGHVQSTYLGRWNNVAFATVSGDDVAHDTSPLMYNIVTCHDDGRVECEFHPVRHDLPAAPRPAALPSGGKVKTLENWLNMRGPMGNRTAPGELPDAPPRLVWSSVLPGRIGTAGLTLADGRLHVTTLGKGRYEECLAVSLDARDGSRQWQTPLDGCAEGGLVLRPQVGRGYVGTSSGSVFALQLADGFVAWRWNNHDNMPMVAQLCMDETEGTLHGASNWEMYAIHAETGELRWRSLATQHGFTYMGPGAGSPVVVGSRVFHSRPFNALKEGQSLVQSVDKATGRDLQVLDVPGGSHPKLRHASPIHHDGRLYAVGMGLLEIDPREPNRYARYRSGDIVSATPAVNDDLVAVSYHRTIVAYDRASLEVRWTVDHEPAKLHFIGNFRSKYGMGEKPMGAFSAPLIADRRVLVCDLGGRVRCLDAGDGRERWRLELEHPILAAPILSGNALFIADYEGTVHAFAW